VGLRQSLFRRNLIHRRERTPRSGVAIESPIAPPGKHVVLNNLSEQVRECLRHADDCGHQAAAQTCAKRKQDFLDLERRWLHLARSYEFTDRLDDFCRAAKRKTADLPKPSRER